MRDLFLFKKIILLTLVLIIFYLVDFSKINYKYVNKNFIEFDYKNLDSEINKKIYLFFEKKFHKFFFRPNEYNHANRGKFFDDELYLKDKKILKSQISTLNISDYEKLLGDWTRSHGNNYSNRFSNLKNINSKNINKLELAWVYNSNNKSNNIDIQCNPIAVNGIIYTPVVGGHIVAIDGYSGREIWRSEKFNHDVARRGILFSNENKNNIPRLYFNNGSKLIVLNASTGKRDPFFGKNGSIRTGYSKITPLIYKKNLIIASWNKDLEVYDLENGNLKWKYYFGDNKKKYFNQPEYDNRKGGNPWGGISLDYDRGIVFITTGNPSNYFDGTKRPGINSNSNSIIAISISEQKEIWSFQETIHDIWNLDLPAPPVLTSINKNDKKYDVVLTVTKRGNTLILDRLTGKPFFDMEYDFAPNSKIINEFTSPFQLNLKIPEPFSKNIFKFNDLKDLNNFNYDIQTKLIDAKHGFFTPPEIDHNILIYNFHGGAEWMGASVDHQNQIMFVNSNEIAWFAKLDKDNKNNLSSQFKRIKDNNNLPGTKPPWGKITSINLKTGKIIWSKPFGDLTNKLNGEYSGTENFGGLTATDGKLIFATGTLDSKFYIFNSETGDILYEYKLPYIGSSPPTTYLAKNEQFVIVHSTGSYSLEQGYPEINEFGDAILAFKLKN